MGLAATLTHGIDIGATCTVSLEDDATDSRRDVTRASWPELRAQFKNVPQLPASNTIRCRVRARWTSLGPTGACRHTILERCGAGIARSSEITCSGRPRRRISGLQRQSPLGAAPRDLFPRPMSRDTERRPGETASLKIPVYEAPRIRRLPRGSAMPKARDRTGFPRRAGSATRSRLCRRSAAPPDVTHRDAHHIQRRDCLAREGRPRSADRCGGDPDKRRSTCRFSSVFGLLVGTSPRSRPDTACSNCRTVCPAAALSHSPSVSAVATRVSSRAADQDTRPLASASSNSGSRSRASATRSFSSTV
jgi:hypothetical protein